jgi:hypothetical protein
MTNFWGRKSPHSTSTANGLQWRTETGEKLVTADAVAMLIEGSPKGVLGALHGIDRTLKHACQQVNEVGSTPLDGRPRLLSAKQIQIGR